jgi:hypothetical protein
MHVPTDSLKLSLAEGATRQINAALAALESGHV